MYKVRINNENIDVVIIKKRKKNISININRNCVIKVFAPLHMLDRAIEEFIMRNISWIEKKYVAIKKKCNERLKVYQTGEQFLVNGNKVYLNVISGMSKRQAYLENDNLYISLIKKEDENNLDLKKKTLITWYRNLAEKMIKEEVEEISNKYNFATNSVKIKALISTWGNCSSNADISLNWKLVMAPKFVREYVIIHELCHLVEMNHSKKFWDKVQKYCPNYKEAKKWLKDFGFLLTV